jgi:orotate phosphoribosyltransferase
MLLSASDAPRVAQALVGLGAVRIASHQPFIYTSGWASPVYVDAQVLMSDVALRSEIMDIAARCMRPLIAARGINAIVGTESSGIAFAAWLAERLELPMLYLRKRPVGWDITAQLEGRLPADAKVLLVDDVTTDGAPRPGRLPPCAAPVPWSRTCWFCSTMRSMPPGRHAGRSRLVPACSGDLESAA